MNNYLNQEHELFLNDEFKKYYNNLENTFRTEIEYFNNHSCPNCGIIYDVPIKTTRICKYCKKKIYKRSNYHTKQCFLLSEERYLEYIKFEKSLNELNFYENKLLRTSYSVYNLKHRIAELRKKNEILNARDILWSLYNQLYIEKVQIAIRLYNDMLKSDDYQIKVLKIFDVCKEFHSAYYYLKDSIDIAIFKNKEDILISLISTYTHAQISIEYLYYSINDCATFHKEELLNYVDIGLFETYIKMCPTGIKDLELKYKSYCTNFTIPIISTNVSWKIVKKALLTNLYA